MVVDALRFAVWPSHQTDFAFVSAGVGAVRTHVGRIHRMLQELLVEKFEKENDDVSAAHPSNLAAQIGGQDRHTGKPE